VKVLTRKIARFMLVLFASLFLILLLSITTPIGTKGLIVIANKSLSALNVEHESGSFASTLALKQLSWKTDSIHAHVADLSVNLDWQCLSKKRLCIEELASSSISVNIKPTPAEDPQPDTEPSLITLPIAVSINNVDLAHIKVTVEETITLTLAQLKTSLSMHNQLDVAHFSWASLDIQLPEKETQAATPQNQPFNVSDIAKWQYMAPDIKTLFFPIIGSFNNIRLGKITVNQGDSDLLAIESVNTRATINQQQLNIQQLDIGHDLGQLALTTILKTNFTHQLDIDISSELEQQNLTAKIASSGSPSDLHLTVETNGLASLSLTATTDITDPQLPLNAQLRWKDIHWPIESGSPKLYQSEQGDFSIEGTTQQYQVKLATQVAGDAIPKAELSLALSGNQQAISLEELLVNTLKGHLRTSGQLALADTIQWNGSLAFADIQPHTFIPLLDAELSGQSEYDATFDGKDYRLNLDHLDMTGLWRGYSLKALGEGVVDSQSGVNLPRFNISIGDNSVDISAALSKEQALDARLSINAKDLAQLLPTLDGQVQADSQVSGSVSAPEVQFTLDAQSLVLDNLTIKHVTTTGNTVWSNDQAAEKPIDIKLSVEEISVAGQNIEQINVGLTGTTKTHTSDISLTHEKVTFNSQLSGSLSDDFSQWLGKWLEGGISSDIASFTLNQAQPDILVNWRDTQYAIGAHCWTDNDAQLCIKDARFANGQADVEMAIQQLPLFSILYQLTPELAVVQSDALLNIHAVGTYRDNIPEIDINASLTAADWTVGEEGSPFNVEQLTSQTVIGSEQAVSTISLVSKQLGQLNAEIGIDDVQSSRHLEGTVNIDALDLSYFAQLTPQLTELSGIANADLTLSGQLTKPLINGTFGLEDGTISSLQLPSRISQINQDIKFEGESAILSGTYLFGDGLGQVDGQVDWQNKPEGSVTIHGENMEIDHQNIVRAKISPDLRVTFSQEKLSVNGELTVPYARVKVRELPPSALSPSDDTVLVNQKQEETSPIKEVDLDLEINVDQDNANDVKIDAFGLTSDLQGQILITQNGATILGDGQLNLLNGRYRAYGQDLAIRKGEIQFNGPVDSPFLDIEAIRNPEKTADEVIAGLQIAGPSQQPQIAVFSDPELEQPEALSYLLRGQSISSTSGGGNGDAALANLLIGFGLSKGENRITKLGSKLGIEDFSVATTGQGNDTKVAVSGNIAKGVQLRYGVGVFDSASEVALRYQLLPKLYLEAVSGLNNALDIYYQFNLQGKKTDEPKVE
jgi:translocation and assembly module TamB